MCVQRFQVILPLWGVLLATTTSVVADGDVWTEFGGKNRDFSVVRSDDLGRDLKLQWTTKIGSGFAGVVADSRCLFTMYLDPPREDEQSIEPHLRENREVLISLDRKTGQPTWTFEAAAGWLDSQQAFGGRARAPQATPLLMDEVIIGLGFTGLLHCVEKDTGKKRWSIDLVDRFGPQPVQFGYAASPIRCEDDFIVLAGGDNAGLVRMDIDGGVIWSHSCGEASYATPVMTTIAGVSQVVFVTRNRTVGVDADTGKRLWEYRFPKSGLTNVPTPLFLGAGMVLLSGQGIGGTQRLQIESTSDRWNVTEEWFSDEQFFYCNWVHDGRSLFASDGSLLRRLDLQTGKTTAKIRRYEDANLLRVDDRLLVVSRDGHASWLSIANDLRPISKPKKVLEGGCWTPPTLLRSSIVFRGEGQVACYSITETQP